MLENDRKTVNDRIENLEKRVEQQDNELICLKSTLADLLRRFNQIESSSRSNSSVSSSSHVITPAQSSTKTPSTTSSNLKSSKQNTRASQDKPLNQSTINRLTKASSSTDLKISNTNASVKESKPTSTVSADKSTSKKPAASKEQAVKDKETSLQYNNDANSVKLYLRGRPVTLYLPDALNAEDKKYDFDAKIKATKEQLKLEWVYGYRGKDCRSNLYQLATGEIIYFIAATVVLYNPEEHTQRHYREHTDDVKSLCIHPDGVTIATGQVAGHDANEGKPHIRIWDSVNLNTLKIIGLNANINDTFQNGLCCLSFSKADSGQYLCAVDDGGEKVLSVWNWHNATKISSIKCYGDLVLAAEFHPTEKNLIVTCGKQHVFFWHLDGSNLNKKAGIFESPFKIDKPKYILCVAFLPTGEVLTGDSEGNILFWNHKDGKISKVIKDAHEGSVFSILVLANNLSSSNVSMLTGGGKDGKIIEWSNEFKKSGRQLQIPEVNGTCRFISQGKGNLFLIGTTKNSILQGNFDVNLNCIMTGHVEELWGLAVNPREATFLTCGNDRNLFYWDLLTHSLLWSLQLDGQEQGTSYGAHSAHFHPTLNVVAIGFTKNKWSVYDLNERKSIFLQIEGTEQIECIQYSPNGNYLAVGSRDNSIYVYTVSEDATKYSRIGRCQGHSSFITHLDWSKDSEYIMSNSGDHEVLYWHGPTCKQVTHAQQIRNIEWASNNCTLSPNTFGIWASIDTESQSPSSNKQISISLDGTDINSSCVSNSKLFLATGDDFGRLNLYAYPCNTSKCEKRSYHGHSSHVTNVRFVNNDTRLISVGGNDMSIFEWSLINE